LYMHLVVGCNARMHELACDVHLRDFLPRLAVLRFPAVKMFLLWLEFC
jgi:hypothetical protein